MTEASMTCSGKNHLSLYVIGTEINLDHFPDDLVYASGWFRQAILVT
jgi:hypothetical protein